MNVFIVSAEAVPFAKVGGLADVTGSLPAALRREGIDARVIMPGYGFIEHFRYNINLLFSFDFTHHNGVSEVQVYSCVHQGVPFYFIQLEPFFGSEGDVYTDWSQDVPRFLMFNQVALAVAWELQQRLNWFPDVFHVNDWHTGLIPFLLADSRWKQEWSQVASIVTIHNIGYQGAGTGTFSEIITGLSAGTQYSFKAYAINSAGTSYGAVSTFTTTGKGWLGVTTDWGTSTNWSPNSIPSSTDDVVIPNIT
ncbi:MAG: glycogen/starch synthase, partial [Aggregatilineales bacterium]